LLTAPLEIRRARLAVRGESGADRETLEPSADERLRAAHDARAGLSVIGRLLRIDTSSALPDDVPARVLEALR
jgi:hypothetical protein